jgi:murein DD-endopeptidase MepM/ murein hydrolase activator NlpD
MKLHSKLYKLILLLFIFLYTGGARAEKLYQYRDENGVLHYSNIAPDTDRPVKVKQVRVSGVDDRVYVSNIGTEAEPVILVFNEYGGPVEMEFFFLEKKNISSNPQLPARIVIKADTKEEVLRIWPAKRNKSFSYEYSYRYCFGDSAAKHRPIKPYRPPFKTGNAFYVSQAFHGVYSHTNPQSEYAIDIAMPEGTPVCAAREGIVMDIANDFFTGGTDREDYTRRANFIRIQHDDGTMALYAHLTVETIRIGVGRKVSEGEIIAESGNTGFSSGPHLHFAILKNTNMELISLPFRIENSEGYAVTPIRDMLLLAR